MKTGTMNCRVNCSYLGNLLSEVIRILLAGGLFRAVIKFSSKTPHRDVIAKDEN